MRHCQVCGAKIADDSGGVQRVLRMGTFTGGGGFYRNVNLCAGCAVKNTRAAQLALFQKIALVLLGIAAAGAAVAYWLYTR